MNVNSDLLLAARELCADAPPDSEYVRGCAELIIDVSIGLNQDRDKDTLIAFLGAPTVRRLSRDQRRALFASFGEVFADTTDEARYAFTRLALGLPDFTTVSWSTHKDGALTSDEASQVLDALRRLNV